MVLQGYLAWWQEDKKGFWSRDNGSPHCRHLLATHRMPSDSGLSYLPLLETVWRDDLVWKYTNVWDVSACLFENNIPESLMPLLPESWSPVFSTQRSGSCFPPCVHLCVLDKCSFLLSSCSALLYTFVFMRLKKISVSKEKVKSLHVIRSLYFFLESVFRTSSLERILVTSFT